MGSTRAWRASVREKSWSGNSSGSENAGPVSRSVSGRQHQWAANRDKGQMPPRLGVWAMPTDRKERTWRRKQSRRRFSVCEGRVRTVVREGSRLGLALESRLLDGAALGGGASGRLCLGSRGQLPGFASHCHGHATLGKLVNDSVPWFPYLGLRMEPESQGCREVKGTATR